MVVRQGMRPVAVGTAAGVAAALALTKLLGSVLFHVRPGDPVTYAVSLTALAAIALAACVLPAIRATRVDPLVALHED
jgi:ABC-type antimicrobial peptide transport system permease subunit